MLTQWQILKVMSGSMHMRQISCAGPPGMVRDVQFNCNDLNAFIGGGAHLVYKIDSFSL